MTEEVRKKLFSNPTVAELAAERETSWTNPGLSPFEIVRDTLPLSLADIDDAADRLARFAPYIRKRFPETALRNGLIESPLREIPAMRKSLADSFDEPIDGRLFLKMDSDLPIAGSVKARGGIYEVLKHSEELALENNLLRPGDSYEVFESDLFKDFFQRYAIHVGSTGNLGLSIGIMSAALGYRATVHMSADARQWKKDMLRSKGVTVAEYAADYSKAVEEGRRLAQADPYSYFVDDENSTALFLGYAVAARRLAAQLGEEGITVDREHPLFVYLPCGVGGAPGGLTFGLKHCFGDNVFCVFAEPVQAPCMLLGLVSGLHSEICVQDVGLSGLTAADGLAVGRPSGFVGKAVESLVAGVYTVADAPLFQYMRALIVTEGIFIEPSACAAFRGPKALLEMRPLLEHQSLTEKRLKKASHVIWATGGSFVPNTERIKYMETI